MIRQWGINSARLMTRWARCKVGHFKLFCTVLFSSIFIGAVWDLNFWAGLALWAIAMTEFAIIFYYMIKIREGKIAL